MAAQLLTSPTTGILSMYRRPLPATNLGFLTAIMWDGREPSLASQSVDATLIHAQAQAQNVPSAEQQAEIVAFETGIFTAQIFDNKAHELHAARATGGPEALSQQLGKFFVGVNDPLGQGESLAKIAMFPRTEIFESDALVSQLFEAFPAANAL